MLGIGASGTVLSLYPRLRNLSNIPIYSLLLGIWISLSYILSNHIPFDPVKLSWSRIQLLYISLYYVALSIPFFFSGLIIATAFSCISEKSGLLYGADLLGAGAGSMGILYLLTLMGPDKAVFIISSIALSASFIISKKWLKTVPFLLIAANLSVFIFRPLVVDLKMSLYKGLQVALRYPGAEHLKTYFSPFSRIDTFKSPFVRFSPGLSLVYLDTLPEQIGFSRDGGEINAITYAGDQKSLVFLRYLLAALPYEISKNEDILIIDPKGGLHVLIARYYGSKNIYSVESDPVLIKIIKDEFSEFSGGIYDTNSYSGLGRSWLKLVKKKFDIIDISLMGASPSAFFGIAEDYRFTVEAFKEYIKYLKEDGLLSINLYILPPPRIELRLMNTVITAMEELGIKNIEKHIVVIRSWGSICILMKKSPFAPDELEAIKRFSKDRQFDLIHYPGIKEEETNIYVRMPSNEYFTAFKSILDAEGRKAFIKDYIFDITPVRDDSPFFHYYLKLKNIKDIYKIMGRKWQYFIEEGYILPVVFIQCLFLSFILVLLPRVSTTYSYSYSWFLPYFAFLGIGFMFVEVSLIQKTILSLETPSYAVATVVASILISSGIGSLLSYKFSVLRSPFTIVTIALLIFVYSMLLPTVSDIISPYSIPIKVTCVFFILMPVGFLMGIPFPTGLKLLGERNKSLIPWAWAINGCFSVLAPILTMALAMAIGFKGVLWLGAIAYLSAFVLLRRSAIA